MPRRRGTRRPGPAKDMSDSKDLDFGKDSITQTIPFMSLPVEIRNEIYKLCLIDDSSYIQPAMNEHERRGSRSDPPSLRVGPKNRPTIGLLAANRQISQEAKPIFYGCNHFYFSASAIKNLKGSTSYELLEPFKSNLHLFRNVKMRISDEDKSGKAPDRIKSFARMNALSRLLRLWFQMMEVIVQMPLQTLKVALSGTIEHHLGQDTTERLLLNPALLGHFSFHLKLPGNTNAEILPARTLQHVSRAFEELTEHFLPRKHPIRADPKTTQVILMDEYVAMVAPVLRQTRSFRRCKAPEQHLLPMEGGNNFAWYKFGRSSVYMATVKWARK